MDVRKPLSVVVCAYGEGCKILLSNLCRTDVRTCVNGVVSDLVGTVNRSGFTRYHDGNEESSSVADVNIDKSSLFQAELDQG